MNKELTTEKTMTVKEIAETLGVLPDSLRKNIRKTFPNKMINGKTTYLTEEEVVVLKRNMVPTTAVVGAKTDIERKKIVLEAFTILNEELDKLKHENEIMKPKADFYDTVTDSRDTIDMGKVAKVLNLGYGRNTLFEKLRDSKVLMKDNTPYQKYCDCGYFHVYEQKYERGEEIGINLKTVVYQKGVDFIKRTLSDKVTSE